MIDTILSLLPDLEAREAGEAVPEVTVQSGLMYQTLVLDTEDTTDVELFRAAGLVESYVVLPKRGEEGVYIQALVPRITMLLLQHLNETHRVVEYGRFAAAAVEQMPGWARTETGDPAHVFLGVGIGRAEEEGDDDE